jgi:hypothetical protein
VTGSPAIVGIRASLADLLRTGDCFRTIAVNAHEAVRLDPAQSAASAPAGDKKEADVIHDKVLDPQVLVPHAFEQADRTLPARVLEVTSGVEVRFIRMERAHNPRDPFSPGPF